jgi:[acyl-carrier-protein] S-malonyltransferase
MQENTQIGLLFPGQGAQKVGMGQDIASSCRDAADVFDQASETLGYDLAEICFNGPEEKLTRTDICQPAILTSSIAAIKALLSQSPRKPNIGATAGLSLGEYTALVAAGSFNFKDAVRIAAARGRYMQEACDEVNGTMYSIIGMEDEEIEDICQLVRDKEGLVWPANYNSPGQLVISGETESAARAARLCEEAGARKVIQLQVAGAFHSPLMESAAERLKPELETAKITEPKFPVITNVSGKPSNSPEDIKKNLLKQITHPVRWKQSMQWCIDNNISCFYETGPGRVLCGLLRRVNREARCESIMTQKDIESFLSKNY